VLSVLPALGNERNVAILNTRHIETDILEFCVYFSGSVISKIVTSTFLIIQEKKGPFVFG